MFKLLIVDNSALMRKFLRSIFEDDGTFEVRTARNGRDALDQVQAFSPDVVTLDVNMPEMDGLSCLNEIMTTSPRPVVMVSSITSEGAVATLEAMQLGAVDYLEKPGGTVSLNIDTIRATLVAKVKTAARAKPRRSRGLVNRVRRLGIADPKPTVRPGLGNVAGIVLIGVSTGGPRTLEDVLPELPAGFPWPVIVAQHMPGPFTAAFASRLNNLCTLNVTEVSSRVPLSPGFIYIGRGDADIVVETRLGRRLVNSVASDPKMIWHPSVERLVRSAMDAIEPRSLVSVQLTGMGDDGADAMVELRRQGGRTIAEDESTAIVFGMPAELIKRGGASTVLPAHRIASQLTSWLM